MTNRKRAPARRNKKRGFGIDLNLGRNVPIIGGSSLRLGTRNVKNIVRRELDKQEETKQVAFNETGNNFSSGTVYTYAPTQLIGQGVSATDRVGRKIFLKHLTIKGQFRTDGFTNVIFRYIVLWAPKDLLNAGTSLTELAPGLGATDLFIGAPGSSLMTNAMFNNKLGLEVICDRKFTCDNVVSGQPAHCDYKVHCPIMKNVQYVSDGVPSLFKDKQLYVVIIGTGVGTVGGTGIGATHDMQVLLTFKDA